MTVQVQIIGLGYVGLTLGVYLAIHGKRVHGVDVSGTILDSLEKKKAHFYEKGFNALLKQAIDSGNFTFGKKWISASNPIAHIITVGTPLGEDKRVNLDPLNNVLSKLKESLKESDIVILRSTVRIGITRDVVKKSLDQCNLSYFLGFCPERTLEGSAIEELASLPQIISGIDKVSLTEIKHFFESVSSEVVSLNTVEEAEMVKLINNSERDLSFALANEIALMCDAKGLSASNVIQAVNHRYSRSSIKRPGPSGGPCLSKDPYILTEGFLSGSYIPRLFNTGRTINEDMIEISLGCLFRKISIKPNKIAVLGFAFKGTPPTGDMRGSLVYSVIKILQATYPNAKIWGHDYLANHDEMKSAGVSVGEDVLHTVSDAELIILQNNHPRYSKEPWGKFKHNMASEAVIYDFWNQFPQTLCDSLKTYYSVGNMGGFCD